MDNVQTPRENVKKCGLYPPRKYNKLHLYVVDDVTRGAHGPLFVVQQRSVHHTKCDLVRDFFIKNTDCEVHDMVFPPNTRKEDVYDYFRQEVSLKTPEDLIIVYYHGKAGCEETEYSWHLSSNPSISVNAYTLIDIINKGPADCSILLDAWIHTRITNKWKRAKGTTEILARPERMADNRGKTIAHDSDFTEAVIGESQSFVDNIHGIYANHKKMKSIPDIVARDKSVYSNAQRIWLDRPKFNDGRIIKRIRIDPKQIRAARPRRMDFYAVQIQGDEVDLYGNIIVRPQVAAPAVVAVVGNGAPAAANGNALAANGNAHAANGNAQAANGNAQAANGNAHVQAGNADEGFHEENDANDEHRVN